MSGNVATLIMQYFLGFSLVLPISLYYRYYSGGFVYILALARIQFLFLLLDYAMDSFIIPNQCGFLILNPDGAVISSGGELENDEKTATVLHKLIHLSSNRLAKNVLGGNYKRLTVMYKDHSYVICLSNRKIHIIKKREATQTSTVSKSIESGNIEVAIEN